VDVSLTTREFARMIKQSGIDFVNIPEEQPDCILGAYTGAGTIFGTTGGVMEAALRSAVYFITGKDAPRVEFEVTRGMAGVKEGSVEIAGKTIRIAVAHGLANVEQVLEKVRVAKAAGEETPYHFIEVMACPGGCVGGAGQPVTTSTTARALRTKGLYNADKMLQLHKSQDNVFITECYANFLGEIGGEKAHHLLHTGYQSRRRIADESLPLMESKEADKLKVSVCLGTNCFVKGSQDVLNGVLRHAEQNGLEGRLDVRAGFCFEQCEHGPNVMIDGECVHHCTAAKAIEALNSRIESDNPAQTADKD
jgi:NADH-quinone oxidoreductase subunit G